MSSSVNAASGSSNTSTNESSTHKGRSLADLNIDDFMSLLITQLQQQDPMNPMDNAQMMEQISQIRAIQANTKLTETLETVSLGQSISMAGSLIGRKVTGLNTDAERVEGVVDKVTVTDSKPILHIGDNKIELNNIEAILPTTTSSS